MTKPNFYYPPGGILIWIIVLMELITFAIASIFFMMEGKSSTEEFQMSASLLNAPLGTINTIVLLISGFFAALSLYHFKEKNIKFTKRFMLFALLGGLIFIFLKSYEYFEKIEEGYTMMYNTFFTFYWLLTGFHLIHLLVGMVILLFVLYSIHKKGSKSEEEDLEAASAFWHMCDLIWLMLFPILYLLF